MYRESTSARIKPQGSGSESNLVIPLPGGEIHVWLTFYDQIADEQLLTAYRQLLNDGEAEHEQRFEFARDRQRYLVTRALVRSVLSRYSAINPKDWMFVANSYGRPGIGNTQARDECLSFNISHTGSLIVLGVTRVRSLGVDVENLRAREMSAGIANTYFAPAEAAALASAAPRERQYRFFEYWTLKEAYIKARGMGLSLPLDKFSIHYPADRAVEMTVDPELADPRAWHFWQFRPKQEYLVAICAERTGSQRPGLILREAIPMVSETEIKCDILRVSQ